MIWYAILIYAVPIAVAVASLMIGAIGLKFYWDTVVRRR